MALIDEQPASIKPYFRGMHWLLSRSWYGARDLVYPDFNALIRGEYYDIQVAEACIIIYEDIFIPLEKGWNINIVWGGEYFAPAKPPFERLQEIREAIKPIIWEAYFEALEVDLSTDRGVFMVSVVPVSLAEPVPLEAVPLVAPLTAPILDIKPEKAFPWGAVIIVGLLGVALLGGKKRR